MPIEIPWSAPDGKLTPGRYKYKIREAKEKFSKGNAPMIALTLDAVGFGKKLCYDNIMLGGDGWGIGKAKLQGLGIGENMKQLDALSLIGSGGYVAVKSKEYNGKTSLEVDISQGSGGYWDIDQNPGSVIEPPEADVADAPLF